MHHSLLTRLAAIVSLAALSPALAQAPDRSPPPAKAAVRAPYVPPKGSWETRAPADVGMDGAALSAAVEWAKTLETDMPRDFSTQARVFGRPLGPVPSTRALTNGIILRHGYIVAEWGDTQAVDPTYSIAKSYLAMLLGLAVERGMIKDVTDPVAQYVHDGGYDSPHNAKITWENHVTQTSDWDGVMFGKPSTFIGREEFGEGELPPRNKGELFEPGTHYEYNDVRVNRFALSLLRVWKKPLPEVLKAEIMDKIGASDSWVYHGYDNSTVDIDGTPMKSVSGGTRWGGGLWISTRDHARFGLLMLRRGQWGDDRVIPEAWVRRATTQQGVSPGYGYLWWLNTANRWPGSPTTSFSAQGAGNNTIWVDPEHDLVVVWRWHLGRLPAAGNAQADFYRRVIASIKRDK